MIKSSFQSNSKLVFIFIYSCFFASLWLIFFCLALETNSSNVFPFWALGLSLSFKKYAIVPTVKEKTISPDLLIQIWVRKINALYIVYYLPWYKVIIFNGWRHDVVMKLEMRKVNLPPWVNMTMSGNWIYILFQIKLFSLVELRQKEFYVKCLTLILLIENRHVVWYYFINVKFQ